MEKIKVAELEVTVAEDWPPGADDALLRLARASRAQHDWMFDWMCGDADADVAAGLYDALTDALSAFDFTD